MSHLHHKVSALVDGELSPAARSRALAHARSCPQCRQEIADTLEVKRRLHKLGPVELSDDLLHVVALMSPARSGGAVDGRSPLLRRVLVAAGSLSTMVVVLAYVAGAPPSAQQRPLTPRVDEFAAEFAEASGVAPLSDPAIPATSTRALLDGKAPVGLLDAEGPETTESGVVAPGYDEDATVPATGPAAERAAVRLLRRAVAAPQRMSYQGVRVVRAMMPGGVQRSAVSITHTPGQGTVFSVKRGGPAPRRWFVSDAEAKRTGAGAADQLAGAYDLHLDGAAVVAGRPAHVVSASDDGELTARFWIDDATGLLLRKTMYVGGRLVRWSGYTSLDTMMATFLPHVPPEAHIQAMKPLSGSTAAGIASLGWICPARLTSSFRLSSLSDMNADGGVMHASYSDGMSTVAVFEQRGTLDATALQGFTAQTVAGRTVYVRVGLPMVAVLQSGERVLTVVTDAPGQVVGRLLGRLPRAERGDSPADGPVSRIGHGLTRLASAVSP